MEDICFECGDSVKLGSGKYVNRIPNGDDYKTNKECNRPFPKGKWLCGECDEKFSKEVEK